MEGEYSNNVLILLDHPAKEFKKIGKFTMRSTSLCRGTTHLRPPATTTEITGADLNSQVLQLLQSPHLHSYVFDVQFKHRSETLLDWIPKN